MRLVVGLGGNALLKRGDALTLDRQRANVRQAARQLSTIAAHHCLVVTHGNGPQIGLLALQAEASTSAEPYPLDVIGAETEGLIGYLIEQELRNARPDRTVATILTMVVVSPDDPAFQNSTKPIGPTYSDEDAQRIRDLGRWTLARDGDRWRRVVPSPLPREVLQLEPIKWLLERDAIVVCAGGGGIPMVRNKTGALEGIDGVIDKDRASALLASQLEADVLVLATDVDAVYEDWEDRREHPIRQATPDDLARLQCDTGTMGPKVDAAGSFVSGRPARRAVIGALSELEAMIDGTAGTQVTNSPGDAVV